MTEKQASNIKESSTGSSCCSLKATAFIAVTDGCVTDCVIDRLNFTVC